MTSNRKYSSAIIEEILSELAAQGIEVLRPSLERLFNELMLIERENALKASPYERTDKRKGYANGFKDKMLHTRAGKLKLQVPKACNMEFYS